MGRSKRATDSAYLGYQYDDATKLRIRIESHTLYSEAPDTFADWLLPHLDPAPGVLLDVGCGPGSYHAALAAAGMRIVGLDASAGMTREVRLQARARRLPVWAVRGDAVALPVRDRSCDRVMANHMLYHVGDQPAALREMSRVLKPGGRVMLTTNAAGTMGRLEEVHEAAARDLGLAVDEPVDASFTLDDLPLVRAVFPTAERHIRHDAFAFPDASAAVRYYATGMIDRIAERPIDGSHRAALLPLVTERIAAIVAREGGFRVPKSSGCFVAMI